MIPEMAQTRSTQSFPSGSYSSGHTNFAELLEVIGMMGQLYYPTFTPGENFRRKLRLD